MTNRMPVNPFLSVHHDGVPGDGEGEDELVHDADMVLGDPIVGQKPPDEYSTVIRGVPAPKEMSVEWYKTHCLTHIPMHPACEYCAMAKKPNVQHRRSPGGRQIPLMVADYGYLTLHATQEVVPYLCVHVRPWRLTYAMVVDVKGPDPTVVKRIAQLISDIGLTHFVYRSDREPALTRCCPKLSNWPV